VTVVTAAGLETVPRWRERPPAFTGVLAHDAAALTGYVRHGESVLAALPVKAERDAAQQEAATQVLRACRAARDLFINTNAEPVYDALTGGRALYLRLDELAYAAAERFAGLVPTRAQIAQERAHVQADKDGHEIDQGIFFRGLLRSSAVGAHLIEAMLLGSPRAQKLLPAFCRSGRVQLQSVSIERSDGTAHITVENGRCLNAEDDQLADDIETAVDLALLDTQVQVGVLRGGKMTHRRYRGKRVFSAGINLADLRNGRISFVDFLLRREMTYINKIAHGLLPSPGASPDQAVQKPWVAAVDSFAIGGGMQLLLVFDRVIAADDTYFSLPAAQEGIVPGVANLRLTRQTGSRLARQIILAGRKISAAEPAAELLCDEVVPAEEMDGAIGRAVAQLAGAAVIANRRMLNLAEEPLEAFRRYLAEFSYTQAVRLYSDDVIARLDQIWSRGSGVEKGTAG